MLPKVIAHISLLLIMTSLVSSAKFPEYCKDCEEEVWEEVPCEDLLTTTSTTTTPAPPITYPPVITTTTLPPPIETTARPSVLPPIEVPPPILPQIPSLHPPLPPAPIAAAFKKCYCECKDGCREFCRKTLVNPNLKKQITQVSKTAQSTAEGLVEVQHLHQRNFVPTTYEPAPAPVHVPAPVPAPAPAPVPAPAPSAYNRKPYNEPLAPATAPGCGTVYPVGSSAEIDNICGGSSPSYNPPSYPAAEKPKKYYSSSAVNLDNYNTIDDLAQLLKSSSYSNTGSIFYPPSSPPNSYPSNPPPNSYPSYPLPPNSYVPYPPPVGPSSPKMSKYSKSYKRLPSAYAAATTSINSNNPDSNSVSCSEPKLNNDIDINLGNYYRDYLLPNSDTEGEYPTYQLPYPISF